MHSLSVLSNRLRTVVKELCSLRASSTASLACALACVASAQSPRYLNNDADVLYIYGDPTGAGGVADLYWMVWPRQSMISPTGTVEVSALRFEVYDTDWTTTPILYDLMFGPGATNAFGVIEPDFSATGMSQSTLILGGPSGLPNPCTLSPGFCTSIGGTSQCPPSGSVTGYNIEIQLSPCDGSGIVLTANNTVDNVVTAFLPAGMTWASGPTGPCGGGDYTLITSASNDEKQADTLATLPGASRYGGFQVSPTPGLNPETVSDRSTLQPVFCGPIVNTTLGGDRGTIGLHVDLSAGGLTLQQVVADEGAVPADVALVACSLVAPLAAPGVPFYGAGLLLDASDPTFGNTLLRGPLVGAPPAYAKAYVPPPLVTPQVAATTPLVLSSQGFVINKIALTARATPLTQTRVNH